MAFNTFNEYIESNRSEKILIAHIHGVKRLYNFAADLGVYSRVTDHFVNSVKLGTTSLTRVDALVDLDDNTKFYYDIPTSKLYLFEYDQTTSEVIVEFRFFFSNVPLNLAWDLDSGEEVYYEPRIQSAPSFSSQMTQNNSTINLVGSGNLSIINEDGYFDSIYETIFFENKNANIYSYNRDLAATEAKQIFRGIVTGKAFASDKVTFSLSDDIYALSELVTTTQYGDEVIESDSTRYKRVVYGKQKNLLCQSLDQYEEDGYQLTGAISGNIGEEHITGTGTSFLSEVSPGDALYFPFNDTTITVEAVKSDTKLAVSEIERSFSSLTAYNTPEVQYYNRNREFQISNHALKKAQAQVTYVESRNRFQVDTTADFEAGDKVIINSEVKTIRRISGDTVVLNTNLNSTLNVNDYMTKREVFNVRYGQNEYELVEEDITIDNASGYCKFTIPATAEFDTINYTKLSKQFTFLNGRRNVWLGKPTIYTIECTDNTAGDLYGEWFTIKGLDGENLCFWFRDVPEGIESTYEEPDIGADSTTAIIIRDANATAEEVTDLVIDTLIEELDFMTITRLNTTTIDLASIDALPLGAYNGDNTTIESDIDPITYTSGTGVIELENSVDLQYVQSGMYFEDSLGSSFQITNVTDIVDFKAITIATGQSVDLSAGAFIYINNRSSGLNFTFYNAYIGSPADALTDLTTILKPRDYIKTLPQLYIDKYEILEVNEQSITLREPFDKADYIGAIHYKQMEYIGDSTEVYVDCLGKTKDGTPTGESIISASEVIYDLLDGTGLSAYIDTDAFDNADIAAPELISLKIPETLTATPKSIADTIKKLNQTVLGSIFINEDLDLGYDILDAEIPLNSIRTIREDDVVSWTVKADAFDLARTTIGSYKFTDYDPNTESASNSEVSYTSEFVDKYIGNTSTKEIDAYLFNEEDAQELIERNEFINSLANSTIVISGKLNLSKYKLGERVLLDFNRLYVALGSTDNTKRVGIITSIDNNGEKVNIEIEDVGALYSRGSRIVDDAETDDFSSSTDEEQIINSFIVDDNDIIDTDEDTFSTNLIG